MTSPSLPAPFSTPVDPNSSSMSDIQPGQRLCNVCNKANPRRLHQFPEEESEARKWAQSLRWTAEFEVHASQKTTKSIFACDEHFTLSMYNIDLNGNMKLREGAVPTRSREKGKRRRNSKATPHPKAEPDRLQRRCCSICKKMQVYSNLRCFPLTEEGARLWAAEMNWTAEYERLRQSGMGTSGMVACLEHFSDEAFLYDLKGNRLNLRRGAVPTKKCQRRPKAGDCDRIVRRYKKVRFCTICHIRCDEAQMRRFPARESEALKWARSLHWTEEFEELKREKRIRNMYACLDHFSDDDYYRNVDGVKLNLRRRAVPTILRSKRMIPTMSKYGEGDFHTPQTSEMVFVSRRRQEEAKFARVPERLLKRRLAKNRESFEYLVKWKNCEETENTWEPEENLVAPTLIAQLEEEIFQERRAQLEEKLEKMDVERKPVEILEDSQIDDENCFYIRFSDGTCDLVRAKEANLKYWQLVVKFYAKRDQMKPKCEEEQME